MAHYLRENFYITTSRNFRAQALTDVLLEVGADHVLYSVDYPFDDMTNRPAGSTRLPSANLTACKLPGATLKSCSTFDRH